MSVVVGGGVGPQVKNFEQVSSNDHQISLAGAWTGCPRSAVGRGGGRAVASKAPWVILTQGHHHEQTDKHD